MFGFATERLARQRRRIGNGNRLGAAERADKLAVQNIAKYGIADRIGSIAISYIYNGLLSQVINFSI